MDVSQTPDSHRIADIPSQAGMMQAPQSQSASVASQQEGRSKDELERTAVTRLTPEQEREFENALWGFGLSSSDLDRLETELQLPETFYLARGDDPYYSRFRMQGKPKSHQESGVYPGDFGTQNAIGFSSLQEQDSQVVQYGPESTATPAQQHGEQLMTTTSQQASTATSQPTNNTTAIPPASATPDPFAFTIPGRLNGSSSRISVPGNGYGDDLLGRPPVGVLPPKGIPIGAIEILTFFPCWLQLPDIVMRLVKAGWTRDDIAMAQLYAVKRLDYDSMFKVSARTQKQISIGGKLKLGLDNNVRWSTDKHLPNVPFQANLTLDRLKTRHDLDSSLPVVHFANVKLADIAASVMQGGNWPRDANDPDRLQFTQVLEHAYAHPEENLRITDTANIIEELKIASPGALDGNHDAAALQRFRLRVDKPTATAEKKEQKRVQQANWAAKHKAQP